MDTPEGAHPLESIVFNYLAHHPSIDVAILVQALAGRPTQRPAYRVVALDILGALERSGQLVRAGTGYTRAPEDIGTHV